MGRGRESRGQERPIGDREGGGPAAAPPPGRATPPPGAVREAGRPQQDVAGRVGWEEPGCRAPSARLNSACRSG